MNTVQETALTVCTVLIGTELVGRLVPKNSMMKFVRGLVFIVLLLSAGAAIGKVDFQLTSPGSMAAFDNSELSEYLSQSYEDNVKQQVHTYIKGLLETIEVVPEEIQIYTNRDSADTITVERIVVVTTYETDKLRSKALLDNVVGEEIKVEVQLGGA